MKKSTANSTAGFSRLENRSNLDTKGHRLKPAVLLRRILSQPLSHIVEVPGARDMGQRHANLIVLANFFDYDYEHEHEHDETPTRTAIEQEARRPCASDMKSWSSAQLDAFVLRLRQFRRGGLFG